MANPVTKIRNTAADYRKLDGRDKRRFWTDGILNNALYILMAIFIIYTAIVNHNFLKIGSITNIISLAAASLPFALGVAGCIVLTGTDLSGGRVVGLSAALSAALLQKTDLARRMFSWMPNIPTWAGICIAILAVIAIGAIIGFVNGFFVAKFKLHPFIVTLATQLITYGLILVFFMLNDNNGQPLSGLSDGYSSFIKGKMISIGAVSLPWYVLYARHHLVPVEQDDVRQEHVRRRLECRGCQCLRRERLPHDGPCPHVRRCDVRSDRLHRGRAHQLHHAVHRPEL